MLDNCLEWGVYYSVYNAGILEVWFCQSHTLEKKNSKNNLPTHIILSNLYLGVLSQTLMTTDLDIYRQPSTDGLFVILFLKTQMSHAICHFCPFSWENAEFQ